MNMSEAELSEYWVIVPANRKYFQEKETQPGDDPEAYRQTAYTGRSIDTIILIFFSKMSKRVHQ